MYSITNTYHLSCIMMRGAWFLVSCGSSNNECSVQLWYWHFVRYPCTRETHNPQVSSSSRICLTRSSLICHLNRDRKSRPSIDVADNLSLKKSAHTWWLSLSFVSSLRTLIPHSPAYSANNSLSQHCFQLRQQTPTRLSFLSLTPLLRCTTTLWQDGIVSTVCP